MELFPKLYKLENYKTNHLAAIIDQATSDPDPDSTIWFRLPYCGHKTLQLITTSENVVQMLF